MATNIGMMDSAYFVGRSEILAWINSTLQLNLSKVEEVCFLCSPNLKLEILRFYYYKNFFSLCNQTNFSTRKNALSVNFRLVLVRSTAS